MIRSVKLFKVNSEITFDELHERIIHLDFEDDAGSDRKLSRHTANFEALDDAVYGEFFYDEEHYIESKDGGSFYLIEEEVCFTCFRNKYLIIFANKIIANKIANFFNNGLFPDATSQVILNSPFSEGMIERFLEQNPHQTGGAYMGGLRTPGANSTTIRGGDVESSAPYTQARRLGGRPNYVQLTLIPRGPSIGISRKGIVVFYTELDDIQIINFIRERIFPIL